VSVSTNVPSITFDTTGVTLPAEADILAGVQADQDTAFGGGLNPALETPQGQLASSETAIVAEKNSEIAYVCNQVDPQYASGRFQDALGRIYFMTRNGATSTQVTANLTGIVDTIIPSGTMAQDTSGNSYTLMAQVTIDATGTSAGVFENVTTGPIPCPAGTLTKVYQSVPGWDSVTNPSAGILGNNEETRSEFEYRRQNSVAANAQGTPQAIYGKVFDVPGVSDCYVVNNRLPSIVNSGSTNYPLAPNSIYVAVVGGTPSAIAQAIWEKVNPGCNFNGNTSVTVTDPSGYSYPQPSEVIKFEIPNALQVYFDVQIVNNSSLPSNIISLINTAIYNRFYGLDGTTLERIGSLILATRYYGAIASASANVLILSTYIGVAPSPTGLQIQVGIDQDPTLSLANISVTLVSE
jgi:uncharacterized phage protein gp47/JayE